MIKKLFQLRRCVSVGLLLGLLSLAAGCKEALHTQLSEREANEMLDALYASKLTALKTTLDGKTWTIEVDRESLPVAIRVLKDRGLPRENFTSTGELFKKQGLVSSPGEERVRYLYAVSQELERTLSQIDGVIIARVHPVIPSADVLTGKAKPTSAAVFIKTRQNTNIELMDPQIRNLVAKSIEGLSGDNISVNFTTSEAPVGKETVAPLAPQFKFDQSGALAALAASLLTGFCALAVHVIWRKRDEKKRELANKPVQSRSMIFSSSSEASPGSPSTTRTSKTSASVGSIHLASLDGLAQMSDLQKNAKADGPVQAI